MGCQEAQEGQEMASKTEVHKVKWCFVSVVQSSSRDFYAISSPLKNNLTSFCKHTLLPQDRKIGALITANLQVHFFLVHLSSASL